ncbi:Hypothetical protein D9617_28g064780 [Elsinoe fawcettii]|nr:Hypothetical protein D9617_28g064780 [Elsinoe fawcettii]
MAIASGLGVHIRDAYHFLMQNYHENDRICLFGFSRGAYTARCLAGMVHKVGLLPAHNVQQIPFAYQYYKDDSAYGWKMSREFKKTFCMDVSIHFIGVFDSVASVGFIPRTLPLSSTPWNKATYFRHAMALDEHRAKFQIKQFEKKDNVDERVGSVADSDEESMYNYDTEGACTTLGKSSYDSSITADDGEPVEAASYWQRMRQQEHQKQTDVLEVWFTGAHADVGGGAVENERRHKLAQIPLRWMLRQCFECDTGIIFKIHCLAEQGIDVHTLWPTYTPLGIPHTSPSACLLERHKNGDIPPICRRSTVLRAVDEEDPHSLHEVALWKDERQKEMKDDWIPEHTEDYFDSISDIHDQLVDTKAWWILEFWPTKMKLQLQDSRKWIRFVSLNLGRYRAVQDLSPNLHWTVQQRIKSIGYKINLRLDKDASWKIAA